MKLVSYDGFIGHLVNLSRRLLLSNHNRSWPLRTVFIHQDYYYNLADGVHLRFEPADEPDLFHTGSIILYTDGIPLQVVAYSKTITNRRRAALAGRRLFRSDDLDRLFRKSLRALSEIRSDWRLLCERCTEYELEYLSVLYYTVLKELRFHLMLMNRSDINTALEELQFLSGLRPDLQTYRSTLHATNRLLMGMMQAMAHHLMPDYEVIRGRFALVMGRKVLVTSVRGQYRLYIIRDETVDYSSLYGYSGILGTGNQTCGWYSIDPVDIFHGDILSICSTLYTLLTQSPDVIRRDAGMVSCIYYDRKRSFKELQEEESTHVEPSMEQPVAG
ncbi:MAG: hypothetical protein KatS3mg023_3627 [Armatimonadota bacterium]|nr:MAG: hypothetical protein KatS3mg023_3627 [Armatimonadota bacterium]